MKICNFLLIKMLTEKFKQIQSVIAILFIGIFACSANLFAQTWPPDGMLGTGEESNPWQITTPEHLEALALYVNAGNGNETNGKYYKMMNNIDLIGYAQGEGWMPIGRRVSSTNFTKSFQGNFNGNGNVIYNLTINRPTIEYVGFFGHTNYCTIQNLGIDNCDIMGQAFVGGLAGCNKDSDINNCYATGSVDNNNDTYAGGLIGGHAGGSIKDCFTAAKVRGYAEVGGLVGGGGLFTITNCHSTSNVGGNNQVRGLVGTNTMGEISNCFAANDSIIVYSSSTNISRIGSGTLRNNYALTSIVMQNSLGDVTITDGLNTKDGKGMDIEALHSIEFYDTGSNWYNNESWDIASAPISNPTTHWLICDGKGLPFLSWQKIGCGNYIISASAGENGTITPFGNVEVDEFDNKTFTFHPNTGYRVDSVFVDGVYKTNSGSYTFENVVAHHTIHVTFAEGVGVKEITNYELEITIFPNPTSGELRITNYELPIDNVERGKGENVEIYDVMGRKQSFNFQISKFPNSQIDISHLHSGIYFLKITTNEGIITKKIVKY